MNQILPMSRGINRSANYRYIFHMLQEMMLIELYWYLGTCAFLKLSLQTQKFAIEPQDQTAIIGSKVTLPCRVVNKSGNLQWTRDDFALGLHRNLSDYVRYQMVGADDEGKSTYFCIFQESFVINRCLFISRNKVIITLSY